ncbi:MAG: hypothetical protein CMP21_04935 [Rickettsiales bacterium]|nr:hypothetical protein [Rickettsiales bacterium]|tara:strand:+ start:3980 stop:5143 length:1164 start_codon:yes stop_codon:yes gene_type:complete
MNFLKKSNLVKIFLLFFFVLISGCSLLDKSEKTDTISNSENVDVIINEPSSNVSLRSFSDVQSLLNNSITNADDCYDLNFAVEDSILFSALHSFLNINEVLFSESHQSFVEIRQGDLSLLASYGKSCLNYSQLILTIEDSDSSVLYSTSFDSVSLKPNYIILEFNSSANYINGKKVVLFWDRNNNNINDDGELLDSFDFNFDSFSGGKSLELDRFDRSSISHSLIDGGTPGNVNSYYDQSAADENFSNGDNVAGIITTNISTSEKSIVYQEQDSTSDCSSVELDQLWLKPGNVDSGGHTYLYQNGEYIEGYHEFSPYSVIGIDMSFDNDEVIVSGIRIFNSDFPYVEQTKEAIFGGQVAYSFPIGRNDQGTSDTGCWMKIIFDYEEF